MIKFSAKTSVLLYTLLVLVWGMVAPGVHVPMSPGWAGVVPHVAGVLLSFGMALWALAVMEEWLVWLVLAGTVFSPALVLSGSLYPASAAAVILYLTHRTHAWPMALLHPAGMATLGAVWLVEKGVWRRLAGLFLMLLALWKGQIAPGLHWFALGVLFLSSLDLPRRVAAGVVPLLFSLPQGAAVVLVRTNHGTFARTVLVVFLPLLFWISHSRVEGPAFVLGMTPDHDNGLIRSSGNESGNAGTASFQEGDVRPADTTPHTGDSSETLTATPDSPGVSHRKIVPLERLVPPIPGYDPCAWVSRGRFRGRKISQLLDILKKSLPKRIGAPVLGGRTVKFRMRLGHGVRALFKPMHINTPIGNARGEVAAFVMARMLGMNEVPPAVMRSFDGQLLRNVLVHNEHPKLELFDRKVLPEGAGMVEGAMVLWIEGVRDAALTPAEVERILRPGGPFGHVSMTRVAQVSDMAVLDYVTGNFDRLSGGNVLQDWDGNLYFIDNGAAFPARRNTSEEWLRTVRRRIGRVRKSVLRRMFSLKEADFRRCLGNSLQKERIHWAWVRMMELVAHFEGLMLQWSPSDVLIEPKGP